MVSDIVFVLSSPGGFVFCAVLSTKWVLGIMGSVLLIICLSIAHASMALPSARRSLGFARKTASARNSSSKLGSPLASRVL